jgi:hypothetical protein
MKVLALADRADPALTVERLREIRPDLAVSCGDVPFDHLEFVVSALDKPLLYVPGGSDPDLSSPRGFEAGLASVAAPGEMIGYEHLYGARPGPPGCTNIDRRAAEVGDLRVAGLGGSTVAGPSGANRLTEGTLARRARRLRWRSRRPAWRRRAVTLLVSHMPPAGGPAPGSATVRRLVETLSPELAVHGLGEAGEEWSIGDTRVVAAGPHVVLELTSAIGL